MECRYLKNASATWNVANSNWGNECFKLILMNSSIKSHTWLVVTLLQGTTLNHAVWSLLGFLDCLHVMSVAPGSCIISSSSNNTISQKENRPFISPVPLKRTQAGLDEVSPGVQEVGHWWSTLSHILFWAIQFIAFQNCFECGSSNYQWVVKADVDGCFEKGKRNDTL